MYKDFSSSVKGELFDNVQSNVLHHLNAVLMGFDQNA